MSPLLRKFLGMNWVIVITMTGLLIFGVFAIYSASWMRADEYLATSHTRQLRWILIGFVVFFITSLIDYRWIRWLAFPAYLAGVAFLIVLRFKGASKGGATSWLDIGPVSFQPSQVAIIGGIMALAVALAELQRVHPVFRNHLLRLSISLVLVSVPFILIILEPDIGSASIWGPVAVCMLLAANIPFRYLIVITLAVLIALPPLYWFALSPYQKARIENYFLMITGKEVDTRGSARDSYWVITAIGSAGWDGKGHKGSRIKEEDPDKKTFNELGFVAKATIINDFIFSVVAEEHGFRGSMIMITALLLLLLQCLFVAFYSRDQMGRLIVVGAVALLFAHIFMNIGMAIHLVPVTGLPLPFISYGGTFVLICMFLLGLVESVWIHRDIDVPDENEEKSLFI